jgi:hypothetical protein
VELFNELNPGKEVLNRISKKKIMNTDVQAKMIYAENR